MTPSEKVEDFINSRGRYLFGLVTISIGKAHEVHYNMNTCTTHIENTCRLFDDTILMTYPIIFHTKAEITMFIH